jgi:succinylglutamic semialdehyde dehydrogenase
MPSSPRSAGWGRRIAQELEKSARTANECPHMPASLTSIEPATGETLWTGEAGDAAAEIAAARAAWAGWASRSTTFRAETLRRFANLVRARAEPFADLIARETGKPLWEARTEVEAVIGKVEISVAAHGERTPQRKRDGEFDRVAVRHKPHGVLAVLGPYNFPAHLPNGHIVPALLAGNAIVFKPSEKTPAVGELLVQLYHEAGVPEGVVRCVQGGPETGKALAAGAGIDGLLFTGSARAGCALHRLFAETPQKILALEMGGNNPLVIWNARDVHAAAAIAVQSAYMSAGQRCTAARRLIVEDGKHEELIEAISKLIDRLIVDHPHASPSPYMGPVIDNDAADLLQDAFIDLTGKGGRALRRLDRKVIGRPFLTPALIDVTEIERRIDEEMFGPVLQIVRVADFDAAIAEANATRYGLAASLVGGSPELYDRFWANVRAGVINWNKPTNGAPSNAPFGGIGLSGNHRPSAYYAADYCAYPVTSSEAEQPRASIGVGLADPYAADAANLEG